MSAEANLNGWQTEHAERHRTSSSRMRRHWRRKALERGEATPIFEPFSKRLAPEFQKAIDEARRRGLPVTRLPTVSAATREALEHTNERARGDGLEALGKVALRHLFSRTCGELPAGHVDKATLIAAIWAARERGSVVELVAAE